MIRVILFSILFINLAGCTSAPVYYSFELLSSVDNKYKFKFAIEKYRCNKRQDEDGMYFYPESCRNGNMEAYLDEGMAKTALVEKAEIMCNGQIRLLGQETVKEFAGMSGSYCSGSVSGRSYSSYDYYGSSYSSGTYSGTAYSSCTGSYPIYDYSIDVYYQCIPRSIDSTDY